MALRSVALHLSLAAALLASVMFACTKTETTYVDEDDDDDDTTVDSGSGKPPADSGLGILGFKPEVMYSGFDGEHTYMVPFAVYDADDDLTVTASPAASVSFEKVELRNPVTENGTDLGRYYMVTVKAPGEVTFTAKSKNRTATGVLNVATYTPAAWAAGKARYENGIAGDAKNPPCTDCHQNGQDIDHSPAALATVTDEKIGFTISTGLSTNNRPIDVDETRYPDGHKWKTKDAEEQAAVVTYLRGLEPRGFRK
ncbi:MAG: hypothetical protein KIT84_17130 [Labilithrix sp.]|nr:hypothetical protein [Labilithrix sp.]MCW5812754.1 hypothetical protein [Labilithrix sp.]